MNTIRQWFRELKCQIRGHRMPDGYGTPVPPFQGTVRVPCARCGRPLDAVSLAPDPVLKVYPWEGSTVADATEHTRKSSNVLDKPAAYALEFARIAGGRVEYGPCPTWSHSEHMDSRAVLVWRRGKAWYQTRFAGWADAYGKYKIPGGAWCATNEFERWSRDGGGGDPRTAEELWFAVAPKAGGSRSSYARIR